MFNFHPTSPSVPILSSSNKDQSHSFLKDSSSPTVVGKETLSSGQVVNNVKDHVKDGYVNLII